MSESRNEKNYGESEGLSMQEFQRSLRGSVAFEDPDRAYLSQLQERLARVQTLGGAFEGICFSPDMELLLKRSGLGNKSKMATV
jgi:hypothetical protein